MTLDNVARWSRNPVSGGVLDAVHSLRSRLNALSFISKKQIRKAGRQEGRKNAYGMRI
jgi:hypothetical protein